MRSSSPRTDRSRADGFSLVELLIVIVVLGILAAVVVFAVRSITDKSQENSEATDLRTLETANEAYWLEFGTNATEQDLLDGGYIKELSSMYDLAVDAGGALTITNTRTGTVAGTASAGGGGSGPAGATVGSLEGLVKNATNEAPIAGVDVCVDGTALCATTDGSGTYSLAGVPAGEQTIAFAAPGFTSLSETVAIIESVVTTQNTAMSPQLAAGDVRVVLTWGQSPSDLDSYLWVPSGTQVNYSAQGSLVSAPFAQLDVDDTDGFGPETVTISQLTTGSYSFAVRALGGNFVPAETIVRVYDSGGLIGEYSPPNDGGRWWHVFNLDGGTGNVSVVNTVGSTSGPF
jgi:prepilin-type N-terminal cleavage/methylation domain-containing protein